MNLGEESGTTEEAMLCGFCKDMDIYRVNTMYKLVDSLEAKFENLDESDDTILDMIDKHLTSDMGLNHREFKTESHFKSWEEVPHYQINRYKANCITFEFPDIEWDAKLYNAHVELVLIVGEPKDSVAGAQAMVDLVD